ncbi:MAG: hypothetical protein NT003_04785 [Candidatus Magasanikbacteria bacterium]|nr:hypothetical protein [Candidatus Magasanikbacteria bacterium]
MKKFDWKMFLSSAAWSWLIFGAAAVVVELWRPSFVDYLIPIWVLFVIAGMCGALSLKNKI